MSKRSKAKILVNKWIQIDRLDIMKFPEGFRVNGIEMHAHTASHGKSTSIVICPLCKQETMVYNWSFMGGGKRCSCCNALLGYHGAWVGDTDVDTDTYAELLKLSK